MKPKSYPRYKSSLVDWLGEVPDHWGVQKIGNEFIERPCYGVLVPDEALENEGIPMLRITDVKKGKITGSGAVRISKFLSEEYSRTLIRDGDLILSVVGTIGEAALVRKEHEGFNLSRALARIQFKDSLKAQFALYIIQSSCFSYFVDLTCVGTAQRVLNMADLFGWRIAVPTSQEQLAIASFLDRETAKIDTLISKQEKLIELLKEKRQAVIFHAVTKGLDPTVRMKSSGIEWLGDVPEHWNVLPLKYLVTSIGQGWSPQCENFPASENEWGVLKVGCVNGGRFRSDENKALPSDLTPLPELALMSNDLLISRANTRQLVGSAAVVKQDYPHLLLCDKLYRLRLDRSNCSPDFISHLLGTPLVRSRIELEATGASSSMLNIGQGTILELHVALPPTTEQEEVLAHVHETTGKIDELISKSEDAIALQKEHRIALISAAVTGKIDVRGAMSDLQEAA